MKHPDPKTREAVRQELQQVKMLAQNHRYAEAKALCTRICETRKNDAEAWFLLGAIHGNLNELVEAVECCRRAISARPDMAMAHYNLGLVLSRLGRHEAAIQSFKNTLRWQPDNADVYHEIANTLRVTGKMNEAIANYRRALQINPDLGLAHFNFANTLLLRGEHKEAQKSFDRALALKPDSPVVHSALLHVMNYFSSDPETVFQAHRDCWRRHFAHVTPPSHPNGRDPERRLRVGYVSPDFCRHSVSYFIEPLLAAHDRSRFEVFCYSDVPAPDAVTARLRAAADQWRDIRGLADADAGDIVRRDGIDILVDLAGHTMNNRLPLFARKPAPIQVTYLGYPNTTGLPTMDYRLTDAWADPEGTADRWHVEKLIRLPRGFLCYAPAQDTPPVVMPRHDSVRPVTFGSFNQIAKINPGVISVWCSILKLVPQSRIIVKNENLSDHETRNHYFRLFEENGVEKGRVILHGHKDTLSEHLGLYGEIDVALDTFPYNGATTTCEALWMGVPVVTLAGNLHAGRVGVSLLNQVGLQEMIATTTPEYISMAAALVQDREKLECLRSSLRERMLQGPLCDRTNFTRGVEDAYRAMWREWCRQGV